MAAVPRLPVPVTKGDPASPAMRRAIAKLGEFLETLIGAAFDADAYRARYAELIADPAADGPGMDKHAILRLFWQMAMAHGDTLVGLDEAQRAAPVYLFHVVPEVELAFRDYAAYNPFDDARVAQVRREIRLDIFSLSPTVEPLEVVRTTDTVTRELPLFSAEFARDPVALWTAVAMHYWRENTAVAVSVQAAGRRTLQSTLALVHHAREDLVPSPAFPGARVGLPPLAPVNLFELIASVKRTVDNLEGAVREALQMDTERILEILQSPSHERTMPHVSTWVAYEELLGLLRATEPPPNHPERRRYGVSRMLDAATVRSEISNIAAMRNSRAGANAWQTYRRCGACGADRAQQRCAGCHLVSYCSVACQALHWDAHRAGCAQLIAAATAGAAGAAAAEHHLC